MNKMKLYKFSDWCAGNKLFKVEEVEVEEKEKTYFVPSHRQRVRKDEINKFHDNYKHEMFCIENAPEIFIEAKINDKKAYINSLEERLKQEKEELEKWEKALKECKENI